MCSVMNKYIQHPQTHTHKIIYWKSCRGACFAESRLSRNTHLCVVARGHEHDGTLAGELVEHVGEVAVLVLGGDEEVLLHERLRSRELVCHFNLVVSADADRGQFWYTRWSRRWSKETKQNTSNNNQRSTTRRAQCFFFPHLGNKTLPHRSQLRTACTTGCLR